MGKYLQDPSLATLRQDYAFRSTPTSLAGTGSSKFEISDTNNTSYPVYHVPDWGAATDLCFKRFLRKGMIDNAEFHQVNTFALRQRLILQHADALAHSPAPHIRHRHRW